MKEILLLILSGVLVNNYAFEKFLGVTPLLGYSRKENKLVALGLSVTVVMLLVAAIAYPVQAALANSGLGYLRLLVFSGVGQGVAVTVSLTLAVTVVLADLIGCSLPILARRLGFDPAVMASPFITTLVDAVSLRTYFRLASWLLGL